MTLQTDQSLDQHAQQVLNNAELIYSSEQIHQALDQLAADINTRLSGQLEPVLILPVMNGGLILSGHLITRLTFPLQIDYLHATRYRGETTGSQLHWKAKPQHALAGRTLLIIDDILDEGYTLEAVVDYCKAEGAAAVYSVVLVEKNHPRTKAAINADFTGLYVEDHYVFGFGMDYKGYHRNLDGIYAVHSQDMANDE